MATRFYFSNDTASLSPTVDAGWNRGTPSRRNLSLRGQPNKQYPSTQFAGPFSSSGVTDTAIVLQYISNPLKGRTISGTVSIVLKCIESDAGCNATLAAVVRVLSYDCSTVRGTLFSVFGTDTEFGTSASTRIVNTQTMSSVSAVDGDRIVVELGYLFTAPTVSAQTGLVQQFDTSSDFALTSGLTTNLNSWIEFSQDLFSYDTLGNYDPYIQVGNNVSRSERAT